MRAAVAAEGERIQRVANRLAELDVYVALADVAAKNNTQLLARLPFNPEVAALCDKGNAEMLNTDALANACALIEAR